MKEFILKYKLELSGAMTGAFAGWLYWYYVGCSSGTCAITSSPLGSSIYGALSGIFLFRLLKKEKQKTQNWK